MPDDCGRGGYCEKCEAEKRAERARRILPFDMMILLPGDRLFEPVRRALPDGEQEYVTFIRLEEHPGKGGRHRAYVSTPGKPRYCGAELTLYEDDLKRILAAIRDGMA